MGKGEVISHGRHVVVPVLAGIGNAVLTVPLLRQLKTSGAAGRLTVLALGGAIADVCGRLPEVDEVIKARSTKELRHVRKARADVVLLPFPANRWQYRLLASFSGAPKVVTHRYPTGQLAGLALLPKLAGKDVHTIDALPGRHDVLQNLDLVRAFGVTPEPASPVFPLGDSERETAGESLRGSIVIQPGCGDTVVGRKKRPPIEFFAKLAEAIAAAGHWPVLIEGPDERGVGDDVAKAASGTIEVHPLLGSLGESAAALSTAACYVGVDSGLAHVSAAVGTPAVTLFAAADPKRVCPYGYDGLAVTPRPSDGESWQPLLLYPMHAAGPKLRHSPVDWTRQFDIDDVVEKLAVALQTRP